LTAEIPPGVGSKALMDIPAAEEEKFDGRLREGGRAESRERMAKGEEQRTRGMERSVAADFPVALRLLP
jgi:hypothetical protein